MKTIASGLLIAGASAASLRGSGAPAPWTYSLKTDCYQEGVDCPAGTFCQVEERDNWYPFAASYINRGRCLPYAPLGASCEMPFEGTASFPRKADGGFFERSTLCDTGGRATCTGEHVSVMPPTCVRARDPSAGCMSTQRNGCAGRPSLAECPAGDGDFCFFPAAEAEAHQTMAGASESTAAAPAPAAPAAGTNRMTRAKLEQCASILTSFNGPNFALKMAGGGKPDDGNIQAGQTKKMTKVALAHGSRMAGNAQKILKALWPYNVCSGSGSGRNDDCTAFPLPVPARDDDGGLKSGRCLVDGEGGQQEEVNCSSLDSDVDMSFIVPGSSNGVTDYHCTWAVLHTLSFNGGAVLTPAERRAFGELLMYISAQFDCKVCRSNFVNIIKHFGLPEGSMRETYARWLWQAHNNANEHSYATHSIDVGTAAKAQAQAQAEAQQAKKGNVANEAGAERKARLSGNSVAAAAMREIGGGSTGTSSGADPFALTRTPEWVNPRHEHPWYMTFEEAASVWTRLEGL